MIYNKINIIDKNHLNRNEFFILDTSTKQKLGELKKHDSLIKRIINFHLRFKLASTYYLYHDGMISHDYSRKGNSVYIKDLKTGQIEEITSVKKLGDYSYKWGTKAFEVSSVCQTSIAIKQDNKKIGYIEFEHPKEGLFHTETVISIFIAEEFLEMIPIVILIYLNEFYQNNIGGKMPI